MLSDKAKDVIRSAMANRDEAEELIARLEAMEGLEAIADTALATSEEIGDKVNEIIAAMKA